jgi:50S ribosomal subunit-associated GTPase HflX
LAGLASAAGAEVVLRVMQERAKRTRRRTGSGKLEGLSVSCDEVRADVVIFDSQ